MGGLAFKELARYPMCVAVAPGHPLAKLKAVALSQIAGEPLIAYNRADYPEYHEAMDKIFAKAKRRSRIVEEHDGVTSIVAAVEAGHELRFVHGGSAPDFDSAGARNFSGAGGGSVVGGLFE